MIDVPCDRCGNPETDHGSWIDSHQYDPGDTCIYCTHPVTAHDNDVPACELCGCTRVVFDDAS
jgi:hypothetical protein